ncbi:hypothetical protein GALL_303420 [mine drainage metagenome]|uniref:Uncharacterized protein n=1 Tax=mine drainage metagenome TaxID=410659 RepID=A0A1J5QWW9_9ZZZZ
MGRRRGRMRSQSRLRWCRTWRRPRCARRRRGRVGGRRAVQAELADAARRRRRLVSLPCQRMALRGRKLLITLPGTLTLAQRRAAGGQVVVASNAALLRRHAHPVAHSFLEHRALFRAHRRVTRSDVQPFALSVSIKTGPFALQRCQRGALLRVELVPLRAGRARADRKGQRGGQQHRGKQPAQHQSPCCR